MSILQLLIIVTLSWPQSCRSASHAAADIMELPSLVQSVTRSLVSMKHFLEMSEVHSLVTELSQQLAYLPRTIIEHPSKLIKKLSEVKFQISNIGYGYKVLAEHIKIVVEHVKQLPIVAKYEINEILVQIKEKESETKASVYKMSEDMAAIHTNILSFERKVHSIEILRKELEKVMKKAMELLNKIYTNDETLGEKNEKPSYRIVRKDDIETEVINEIDVVYQTANALIEAYNKKEIMMILSDKIVEDDLRTVLENLRIFGENIGEMTETKVNNKVSAMSEVDKCQHDLQLDLHEYWIRTNNGYVETRETGSEICLCKPWKEEFENCHARKTPPPTPSMTTVSACDSCCPTTPTVDEDGRNK